VRKLQCSRSLPFLRTRTEFNRTFPNRKRFETQRRISEVLTSRQTRAKIIRRRKGVFKTFQPSINKINKKNASFNENFCGLCRNKEVENVSPKTTNVPTRVSAASRSNAFGKGSFIGRFIRFLFRPFLRASFGIKKIRALETRGSSNRIDGKYCADVDPKRNLSLERIRAI